jgi:hypothetical protein
VTVDDYTFPDEQLESEPHARAAERAVLGALLLSPAALDHVDGHLEGHDFYEPRHEVIWQAIQDVRAAGGTPDAITVNGHLMNAGDIGKIGGAPYLHTLVSDCPNPSLVADYAAEVRNSARARAAANLGRRISHLAQTARADTLDDALRTAMNDITELANRTGPSSRTRELDDLFLTRDRLADLPSVAQLIDGVLPRHSYGLLIGRDGTFKTFLALDWGLSIATGRTWQGHTTEQTRVLYIAGEGAHGISARVDAWERAWKVPVPDLAFTTRSMALNLHRAGPDFDHLLDHVTTGGYGLVILDTLRRISGGADGNGSDMGTVIDNIDRLRRATTNGTVLAIAHTAKDDRDTRGFSGIEDDADFVWHAKRPDNDERLEVKNTKQKDRPDGQTIVLTASSAHGSLILQDLGATNPYTAATQNAVRVLNSLRDTFPDGASPGQIIADTDVPDSSFYRTIRQLERDGHVINIGTPKRKFWQATLTGNERSER